MGLKRSRHIIWVTLATGSLVVVVLVWMGRTKESSKRSAAASTSHKSLKSSTDPTVKDPDEALKESLLGSWKREFYGEWLMTLQKGGTGTIVITPSGIWGTLIGKRVDVNLEWSVENGRIKLRSISGKPDLAFKASVQIFGKERIRKIKELTAHRFIMLDEEDDSETEWTRVGNPREQ